MFDFSFEWMKHFNGAKFSTIIYLNYSIGSLASCVNIENIHAPLYVNIFKAVMSNRANMKEYQILHSI